MALYNHWWHCGCWDVSMHESYRWHPSDNLLVMSNFSTHWSPNPLWSRFLMAVPILNFTRCLYLNNSLLPTINLSNWATPTGRSSPHASCLPHHWSDFFWCLGPTRRRDTKLTCLQNMFINRRNCPWSANPKKETFLYWLLWMSPFPSIVQKPLFHQSSHWNEIRESLFSSRKWSHKKIWEGFCHIPTIYAVSPSDPKRFFRKSRPSTWKEVTHWWVGHSCQQVVTWKTMVSTRLPKNRNSPFETAKVHISTWDNMGMSQTYGPQKHGNVIFSWKASIFGDLKIQEKMRQIDVPFINCNPVPQPPKHLDAGASPPGKKNQGSEVRLNSCSFQWSEFLQILWCSTFSQCSIYIVNVESGWICFFFCEEKEKRMLVRAFHGWGKMLQSSHPKMHMKKTKA